MFVGLGSVGKRHLSVLNELAPIEVLRYKSQKESKSDNIPGVKKTFVDFDKAMREEPDFAIVSNPTALHTNIAIELAEHNIPFLLEKPVTDSLRRLDELVALVRSKALPVMIGFQFRHHPGYHKLLLLLKKGEIGRKLSLQGYVGQYLPDWRTGTDYRNSYSTKRNLGGGVIFDLCHEIDLAMALMGKVTKVNCICGKYSDLEIDTEDVAEITLVHEGNRISHIHLNYIEPGYQWCTSVLGTEGVAVWNYANGFVRLRRHDGLERSWDMPSPARREDMFRIQMQQWLKVAKGEQPPVVGLEEGIDVTKVVLAAHESAREGKHVRL